MRLPLNLYSSAFEFLLPLKTAKVYTFPRSLMTLKITELFSRQCSAEIRAFPIPHCSHLIFW